MFQRIEARWKAKLAQVDALIQVKETQLTAVTDPDARERLGKELNSLQGQAQRM